MSRAVALVVAAVWLGCVVWLRWQRPGAATTAPTVAPASPPSACAANGPVDLRERVQAFDLATALASVGHDEIRAKFRHLFEQ